MTRFSKKRFVSKISGSPASYVFLVLLLIFFSWKAIGAYEKTRLSKKKVLETQGELSDLNKQKSLLTADLENANTDFGKEKALREKFNVVREGEKVVMIVPDKKDENPVAESTETKIGFFGFFKNLFKN